MLKRIGWFLFTAAMVYAGWRLWLTSPPSPPKQDLMAASPTPTPPKLITVGSQTYHYHLAYVPQPNHVSLHPNYQEQITSKQAVHAFGCQGMVNGGFYNPQHEPLGWVMVQQDELSPATTSQTHNGFLWIKSDQPQITTAFPQLPISLGLQSGPLLIIDGLLQPIRIINDRPSRRLIAVITDTSELLFIALYDPNTPFGGPMLDLVPEILRTLAETQSLSIAQALNLDGGSASVFYQSEGAYLQELNPVGSFLCW